MRFTTKEIFGRELKPSKEQEELRIPDASDRVADPELNEYYVAGMTGQPGSEFQGLPVYNPGVPVPPHLYRQWGALQYELPDAPRQSAIIYVDGFDKGLDAVADGLGRLPPGLPLTWKSIRKPKPPGWNDLIIPGIKIFDALWDAYLYESIRQSLEPDPPKMRDENEKADSKHSHPKR